MLQAKIWCMCLYVYMYTYMCKYVEINTDELLDYLYMRIFFDSENKTISFSYYIWMSKQIKK